MTKPLVFAMALLVSLPALAKTSSPDCASWPTNMALTHLRNAGLIDPDAVVGTQVKRLSSEPKGNDLYQQVYAITFRTKDGKTVEVITNSQASHEECSMSGVDIYVVSRKLGGMNEPLGPKR